MKSMLTAPLLLLILLAIASSVSAQVIPCPPPPRCPPGAMCPAYVCPPPPPGGVATNPESLRIDYHRVNVQIENQIAHTSIKAPALGCWHTIRVVAVDARMQAWLNDTLLLTSRDTRLRNGRVGLWTTNDSNTAFDDLTIRGMTAVSEGAR